MFIRALGAPITGRFAVTGGNAQVHQGGLAFYGQVGIVTVLFDLPGLGVPYIATGESGAAAALEPGAIAFQIGQYPLEAFLATLKTIVAARIALLPTGRPPIAPVPLQLGAPRIIAPGESGVEATYGVPAVAALQERTLYDISVRADDGVWHPIAPHAIYYRSSWHDFGIAHVTDIHIARRIDSFAPRLREAGLFEAAERMINFNDRFRGFIRYANYLHGKGLLDVILATGDIIDYLFENDDDADGGNALFARLLILGQSPSARIPDVEELRVPIFMVPGNHDYRKHPYHLLFDLDLGPISERIKQFASYRLSADEAVTAQGGAGSSIPSPSADTASRALEIDYSLTTYKTHLADKNNYVVRLGAHRIVMLDSGYDTDLPESKIDLFYHWLGILEEGKETAITGSPNSSGVDQDMLGLVVDTLAETPDGALVIVGLHAPLFNMWDEEYPYFFRESQRTAQAVQATGWVSRRSHVVQHPEAETRHQHPSFFAPDGGTPSYVKRGSPDDLLDYGVSRGESYSLLQAIAGIGPGRKADVVLHGHIHRFNEFRLEPVNGEVTYYTDFYTQNLSAYYPSRFVTGWVGQDNSAEIKPTTDLTYVEFATEAPAGNPPSEIPVEAAFKYVVFAPTNPTPLSSAPDPRTWWATHRPLVLQTEALGPFKDARANLGGFRLMTVKNDVIERIELVSIEALHASNYRIEWADATKPDPLRKYYHAQRSREFGSPAIAGSPCGYVFPARRSQTIIYRGPEGQLFELWRDAQGARGHGDLRRAAPGAPKAVGDPSCYMDEALGMIVVLYRGNDDHVHTLYWATGAVGHDALSAAVNAPPAIGRPVGVYNKATAMHLVIYRADGGNIQALSWKGEERANHEKITLGARARPANGDPALYLDTRHNTNIVVYRANDDHIRSIYWSDGPSGLDDLSGVADSPRAAGDPCAYYLAAQDLHQVYYRDADKHIYELAWKGANRVEARDLTAETGAPLAVSDPCGWHNALANKKHVVYRGDDNLLHDITWTPGGPITHVDLSAESWGTRPSDRPFGFSGITHQHVVYRGTDNQVHEIRWEEVAATDTVLSLRAIARHYLNVTGAVSARRDIFAIRPLPPPRSLRTELDIVRGGT